MKKITALVLALCLAFGMTAGAAFSDVDASTPEGVAIELLASLGVLGGFEDGTFKPEETVTREQFAKIIYILVTGNTEAPAVTETGFTDVDAGRWSAGFIKWAFDEGIVGGMGDGTFAPTATLTMAQATKMMVVADGAPNTLEWPQGFIDVAEAEGHYVNVADFEPDDPAPRGTIALMAYNCIGGDERPDGDVAASAGLIINLDGTSITFAPADENGRGTLPSATVERDDPTSPAKSVTINFEVDVDASWTLQLAEDVEVFLADGTANADVNFTEGSLEDITLTDYETLYYATYVIEDDLITSIVFYTEGQDAVVVNDNAALLALPLELSAHCKPGETVVSSVYYGPQATPADFPFTITSFTQPTSGAVSAAPAGERFWRLRYTIPQDAKVGDTATFTYTIQGTADESVSAIGVVTINIVAPSTVPDKTFNVAPDEIISLDAEFWYEGAEYTKGAPNGVPSFLIYDPEAKKLVDTNTEYTTEAGATVVRASGDTITYIAGEDEGTDVFYVGFHDGWDFYVVKVTVNVLAE